MLLFLLIFWLFFQNSIETNVPICKAVNYKGVLSRINSDFKPIEAIYSYNFNMNITKSLNNATYPNYVALTDFSEWSSNSSLYFRNGPIQITLDNFVIVASCESENETCYFSYPNSKISPTFDLNYPNEWSFSVFDTQNLRINDGVFSEDISGTFFDPNPCVYLGDMGYGEENLSLNITACCIQFDTVKIPDTNFYTCQEFKSETTLWNDKHDTIINFENYYEIINLYGDDYANISINILELMNISFYLELQTNLYIPPYSFECSNREPFKHMYCLTRLHNNELLFIFEYKAYYNAILNIGEIITRIGIYMKNINQPYTPQDPCWKKAANIPLSNLTYEASFCCVKFKDNNSLFSTTMNYVTTEKITTALSITASPQPSSNQSNLIGSLCSTDTSKAWLDIVFLVDTSAAMPSQKLKQMSADISTYMESFTFGKSEDHTIRAGIIGYAKNVTTYYQLIDTTNYDDFVDALFDLANYATEDVESNLQSGLQQAYELLTTQKSYRKQVIVLIAAAYSNTGFQGAEIKASNIKANLINIFVINYEKSFDADLTAALKNISSPGFYYIWNQIDLNSIFPYALTQCNCFCPPSYLQFQTYNSDFQNYTKYADCFFGDSGFVDPKFAKRACKPGVLAAITSQTKLGFITDNVIPHIMKGQKKFTIGLHKSADDEEWKWWGYNDTEYSLGSFPTFSQNPANTDTYGYMWNQYGFNWTLQTGNNIPLPYICQLRACDSEHICQQS